MYKKRLEMVFEKLERMSVSLSNREKSILTVLVDYLQLRYQFREVPGHEMEHVFRVLEIGLLICDRVNCNKLKFSICALLHDVARMIDPRVKNHAEKSAQISENLLRGIPAIKNVLSQDELEQIRNCIAEHSYSSGKQPSSIESMVLQDADRLDALGAIGIARVFAYGGYLGRPIYNPFETTDKESSLGHFYDKILKLPEQMNTEIAREIAKNRLNFVKKFIDKLLQEINLEDFNQHIGRP